MFKLGRHEVAMALDELLLTWATGGAPLGPAHWPPIVARRKELLERLADWTPPPALGVDARKRSPTRCRSCSGASPPSASRSGRSAEEGGADADRRRRVAGHGRGPGARRDHGSRSSRACATATSSSARSPRRPGRRSSRTIKAVVTDIGGVMSHAAIVCREYGLPAVVGTGRATAEIRTGQTIRVDGSTGRRHDPRRT